MDKAELINEIIDIVDKEKSAPSTRLMDIKNEERLRFELNQLIDKFLENRS